MGCGCANCREERFTQYEQETGGARPGGGPPPRPRATVCRARHVFVDCPNPGTPLETLDHFGFNVSELNRPRHVPQVRRLASQIVASQGGPQPIRRVLLAGHTDTRGDDNYNFPLSSRRAEAVKKELCLWLEDMRPGLSTQIAFEITPCGERQPGTRTPEEQRRVEVFLFPGAGGPRPPGPGPRPGPLPPRPGPRSRFRQRDAPPCGVPPPRGHREIADETYENEDEFGYESYESAHEGGGFGYEDEFNELSGEFGYEGAFEGAYEDEFDREGLELESEGQRPTRRPARRPQPQPPAPPRPPAPAPEPRLVFFQNFFRQRDRDHFLCSARPWARRIRAVQSPTRTACATIGPTPYNTGRHFIQSIVDAHACLDKRIELIHVFGHGSSDGFGGRLQNMTGLYHIPITAAQRRGGGRLVTDIPTAPLATNVTFILHNCRLAFCNEPNNFAKALFDHLVGALPDVRVIAHWERGCAGRNTDWKEYTSASPNGVEINPLPASLWTPQEVRPGTPCCDPAPGPPRCTPPPAPPRPRRSRGRPAIRTPDRRPAPQGGRR